jgi:threonine dehydratase
LVRDYVDEIVLVSERAIADAMRYAFAQYVMLEGGAAASLAALQTGQVTNDGKTVAILSGGNVDPHTLIDIVKGTHPLP